jgi:hypothetical protein
MIIISEHSHTGSYSDFSYVETTCFFEDLNVVLIVTKYDSGKVAYRAYGNFDNQEKAKAIYESTVLMSEPQTKKSNGLVPS